MGCFLIQLTTCLSFILFILLDEMDIKSSASGTTLVGQSVSQLSNQQNYHHPLHPDWKFTYHRVYPGNQTSPTSILGTKRKSTGIAAMSIMAIKDKGKMSLRAPATTLSPSIRKHQWSSILEQEFMQSFAAGGARGQRQEEFHWRPWISDADLELTSQHPQRHLSRHPHKRRHWKRHRHDDTSHRHTNTHDTDFLRSIG